jgi:large subunit ribosomal protein L30
MEKKITKTIKQEKPVIKIEKKEASNSNLLVLIRIHGEVKVKWFIEEALDRLRLRRKYACVIVPNKREFLGMIKKVKHYIAYGEIEKETLIKLMKARAQKIDKKEFDAEKISEEILSGKSLKYLGFKPFFRLHPPRGGIKSKLLYPEGVLGNNKKDINKLVDRML